MSHGENRGLAIIKIYFFFMQTEHEKLLVKNECRPAKWHFHGLLTTTMLKAL